MTELGGEEALAGGARAAAPRRAADTKKVPAPCRGARRRQGAPALALRARRRDAHALRAVRHARPGGLRLRGPARCRRRGGLPAAVRPRHAALGAAALRGLTTEWREDALLMDAATRRNLEIETSLGGRDEHTLAGVMDRVRDGDGEPAAAPLAQPAAARPCDAQPPLPGARGVAGRCGSDVEGRSLDWTSGLACLTGHRRPRAHPRARRAEVGAAARPRATARARCSSLPDLRAALARLRLAAARHARRPARRARRDPRAARARAHREPADAAPRRRRHRRRASTQSSTSCATSARTPTGTCSTWRRGSASARACPR